MKKAILPILFAITSLLVAQSVSYDQMLNSLLKKTVATIKISEASQKKSAYFFDTRLRKEYDISHIKNAQWIGYEEFNLNKLKHIPKESEIILYCSVGARSEQIGEKLQKAGYKNVKNLWGGLFQWVNEGHSVVDNKLKITKKVHAYSPEWGVWLLKGEKIYN